MAGEEAAIGATAEAGGLTKLIVILIVGGLIIVGAGYTIYTVYYKDVDNGGGGNNTTNGNGNGTGDADGNATVSIIVAGTEFFVNQTITFDAKVENMLSPSYLWDFDDPNANESNPKSSTEKRTTHTYTKPGTYTVHLVATNDEYSGDDAPEDQVTLNITKETLPTATLTMGPLPALYQGYDFLINVNQVEGDEEKLYSQNFRWVILHNGTDDPLNESTWKYNGTLDLTPPPTTDLDPDPGVYILDADLALSDGDKFFIAEDIDFEITVGDMFNLIYMPANTLVAEDSAVFI